MNDGTSPPGPAPPRAEDAATPTGPGADGNGSGRAATADGGRGDASGEGDEARGGRDAQSANGGRAAEPRGGKGGPQGGKREGGRAGGDGNEKGGGGDEKGDGGDDEKGGAPKGSEDEAEIEDVEDDTRTTLLETRTVLPGLQTLFGFQLAVIFTEHFGEKLSRTDQLVHFVSLSLVAVAVALVMAPAAYHRQVEPSRASRRFTRIASRCLMASMGVMTFAMTLNFFLIADVVFRDATAAYLSAAGAFVTFGGLWFLFPVVSRALDPPPPAQ